MPVKDESQVLPVGDAPTMQEMIAAFSGIGPICNRRGRAGTVDPSHLLMVAGTRCPGMWLA